MARILATGYLEPGTWPHSHISNLNMDAGYRMHDAG